MLRAGYKQAIATAYEQNRAVARVAAIRTVRLELQEDNKDDDTTTTTTLLHVIFPKGVQGRGNYTEDVDYLPLSVLQSVLRSIHPVHPQALTADHLALLSPRVYWSAVYHYQQQQAQQQQQQQQAAGDDMMTRVLDTLCPDLDWTVLQQRRKQTLSAKARENLRQQQNTTAAQEDWEAAAAAIASVERAMEDLESVTSRSTTTTTQQQIAATQESTWKVVTPDELDKEELQSCLNEGPVWETSSSSSSCTREGLVERIVQTCHIHNWRELANADADELVEQLGLLPSEESREHVQAWLLRAQQETLDEIMVEICEGRTDAVEALAACARSATPKDLVAWKWIVQELRDELWNHHYRQQDDPDQCPSVAELTKWCQRAEICLEQLEWTGAFVTPLAQSE